MTISTQTTGSTTQPTGNWRVLALDLILTATVIVCLVAAGFSYSPYSYANYTVSVSEVTGYSETKFAPYLDFNINFTATVFSAQNDIQVSVIAVFDADFQQHNATFVNNATRDTMYFYLKSAHFPTRHYSNLGAEIAPVIILHRQADGSYRNESQTTIIYEYEGYKCFIADFKPLAFAHALCDQNQEPVIYISSADSLFQLKTQHYTAALTWAFGAFAVIIVRDDAIGMSGNFVAFLKKRKNRNNTSSQKKDGESEKSQRHVPQRQI